MVTIKNFSEFFYKYGFFITCIVIFLAIFLEATIIHLPLILLSLLIFFIITRSADVFLMAFLFGMLIDLLTVQRVGVSSVFYIITLFLTSLYERKYSIQTVPYIFIATLISSWLYMFLIWNESQPELALVSALLGIFVFGMVTRVRKLGIRK